MPRCLALTLCTLVALPALAAELTGRQIMDRAESDNSLNAKNAIATVKMTLYSKSGMVRVRKVETKGVTLPDKKGSKHYLKFLEPPDVKGTAFLNTEDEARNHVQNLYIPQLKKTRKISRSQRNSSFMGTDFSYRDLEGYDLDKAQHNRLPDEKVENHDCYVVEAIPQDPKDRGYSKVITYVHKEIWLPLKVRFFDLEGQELKILEVKKLKKSGSHWVATESLMRNLQQNSKTELLVEDIKFDAKIPDEVFTTSYLERG